MRPPPNEDAATFEAALERERVLEEALGKALARRKLTEVEKRLETLANFDAALRLVIRSVEGLVGSKAGGLEEALALLRASRRELRERSAGAEPELTRLSDAELEKRVKSCRLKRRELENQRRALQLVRWGRKG